MFVCCFFLLFFQGNHWKRLPDQKTQVCTQSISTVSLNYIISVNSSLGTKHWAFIYHIYIFTISVYLFCSFVHVFVSVCLFISSFSSPQLHTVLLVKSTNIVFVWTLVWFVKKPSKACNLNQIMLNTWILNFQNP